MNISQFKNFDKAAELFGHILDNIDSFNLTSEDKKHVKEIATEALLKVQSHTDGTFIKNAISFIKGVLEKTTASITASGILYLISQIRM